jgi:hypothetical protein
METVAIPAARNLADSLVIGLSVVSAVGVYMMSGFVTQSMALKVSGNLLPFVY